MQGTPQAVQAMFADALQHHQSGRLGEAEQLYRRILRLDCRHADSLQLLGVIALQIGRHQLAVDMISKAITLNAEVASYHSNLGNALRHLKRPDEAATCFRTAIRLKPDYPEAHNNLGSTLQAQGLLQEAVACYRTTIQLQPDLAEGHKNLGKALVQLGRLDEAAASFRHAMHLRPDDPDAHYLLSTALLAFGEMQEGWEQYEWRWKTQQGSKSYRDFKEPQWRGEAADGRTLLIHAEQGFGDSLQFCRYAPLAAARGLRVIMTVPKPLARLLRGLPGVDLVLGSSDELPPFDLHCPMLSLPLAMGTTLTTIPGAVSYLHADEVQVAVWRQRLAGMANQGPRIGLVWAGNPCAAAAMDRRRSLAPQRLAPLFDLPDVHFFSLQKDGPAPPENFPLTNVMDEMTDFADTAALLVNLDLVISVDTAVAHLAAALGKPVWLLDRFDHCWRWLSGRRDSPWYPTLQVIRQPHPGDWESVLAQVTRDLRDALEAGSLSRPVEGFYYDKPVRAGQAV
jgi:Flp pilus assembly protein TadD